MLHRRHYTTALLTFAFVAGCGASPEMGSTSQALDDEPTGPNGSPCYVQGPGIDPRDEHRWGTMRDGACCFSDDYGGSHCYQPCPDVSDDVRCITDIARATEVVLNYLGNQYGVLGSPVTLASTAQGGIAPYHWSASGLPPGLSIDANTGAVSGAPSASGTYTVTLAATDSSIPPHSATASFYWMVQVPVPNVVGLGRSVASGALGAAGLHLGNERDLAVTNCDSIGTILDQTPSAGSVVAAGTAVSFTLAVRPSGRFVCN